MEGRILEKSGKFASPKMWEPFYVTDFYLNKEKDK